MAIVPSQSTPRTYRPNPVVTLEEYANYISYDECAVLGVKNYPNATAYECRDVWSLQQRQYIQQYLSEAQEEIEKELGYFLTADWVVGDIANERDNLFRYIDQQKPSWSRHSYNLGVYRARWKHVNSMGTRAEFTIEDGTSVNNGTDPAVVTVNTTVTDINEIHVFHPGSDLEINPSEIVISGGIATISIPRCRLVKEALMDTAGGVDYTVIANFEETVDVKRIYTDTTTQAILLCSNCSECSNRELLNCVRILNERLGTFEVGIGNLGNCICGCRPNRIGFNYYAGDINTTQKTKEMVVRLAHSKLPNEPCGCEIATRLWREDREIPEIITQDLMTNPFGVNRGALLAYMWVKGQPKELSLGEI